MTKTRPDQPGRCPSIDPHDTLQCTRAIHDDDQCRAGGIAWRKGSPRIEWDHERADRLQEDVEEYDAILTSQSDLLTRTVNALRGNPPPLTSWSHHDIPELAAEKVAEVERLTAEREWFKDRFPCDGVCVDAPEEACSRHGRNPADLWRIIGEVTAERDALAAQVARVEALAGQWDGDDSCDNRTCVPHRSADALRAALTGSEADTSYVDVCSGDADCTSELERFGLDRDDLPVDGVFTVTPTDRPGRDGSGPVSRPPSQAVIEAVEQAMWEQLNLPGPMRHIFGDEVGDALEVLLAQEVQAAAPEVARAAEAAALRAAAERMDDLSRGTPLAAAITARAAAKRLDHWADELTDTDDGSQP